MCLGTLGETNTVVAIVKDDKVGLDEDIAEDGKIVVSFKGRNTTEAQRARRTGLGVLDEATGNNDLGRANADGEIRQVGVAVVDPDVLTHLVDAPGSLDLFPILCGGSKGNGHDGGSSVGNGGDGTRDGTVANAESGRVEETVALGVGERISVGDFTSILGAVNLAKGVRALCDDMSVCHNKAETSRNKWKRTVSNVLAACLKRAVNRFLASLGPMLENQVFSLEGMTVFPAS